MQSTFAQVTLYTRYISYSVDVDIVKVMSTETWKLARVLRDKDTRLQINCSWLFAEFFLYICKLRVMIGRQFSAIVAIDIQ